MDNTEDMTDVFVNMLIATVSELKQENEKLKQEVEILVESLRAIQWRMDGLDK